MRFAALASALAVAAVGSSAMGVVTFTTNPDDIETTFFQDFTGVPDTDLTPLINVGPLDLNPTLPATATAEGTSTFADFEIFNEQLEVFLDSNNILAITFTFDQPILGFGAVHASTGTAQVTIAGQTFEFADGFSGWVSDTAFSSVTYSVPAGSLDFYTVDDIRVQVVPEPASLSLLGLGALGLVRRRR